MYKLQFYNINWNTLYIMIYDLHNTNCYKTYIYIDIVVYYQSGHIWITISRCKTRGIIRKLYYFDRGKKKSIPPKCVIRRKLGGKTESSAKPTEIFFPRGDIPDSPSYRIVYKLTLQINVLISASSLHQSETSYVL